MASFIFKPLQQTQLQLSSFSHCKYSPTLNTFKFHFSFQSLIFSPLTTRRTLHLHVRARVVDLRLSEAAKNAHTSPNEDHNSGFSSFPSFDLRAGGNEEPERRVILRDVHAKKGLNSKKRKEVGLNRDLVKKRGDKKISSWKGISVPDDKRLVSSESKPLEVEKKRKRNKKGKVETPETTLRAGLDLCSKRGDVVSAIKLYELAKKEEIKMGQYHFAVLLYLCSSAATGNVQAAKSGSASRSLSSGDSFKENSVVDSDSLSEFGEGFGEMAKGSYGSSKLYVRDLGSEDLDEHGMSNEFGVDDTEDSSLSLEGLVQLMKKKVRSKISEGGGEVCEIQVSDDVKRLALQKGFEIYNEMQMEKVPMNEATFTSVARMAMAFGDGDMALDMVKQMKDYGINPRLRSYGPALAIFCNSGDVEKAFMVEEHMLENGVYPEEPELEALLRVSIEAGKSDRVYYILHKLRTSVRQVLPATADLIEKWFKSKVASRVGKRKWDQESVAQAIENGGGGWHGKGWLGTGKWNISWSPIGSDGCCKCCGEKLVTIDLDPEETEKFAQSVASIAAEREKHSSFQKFQKWLEYYGPFEAVVDGANVGLYSQRRFKPSKVNAVVNGIRQMLPSRKMPLVVLHNRRIIGEKMDEPFNRTVIEKWKNADALYATPTGSNDDWYWLYAAIKCRGLLVTNDEMRDHLFQLLGNDFFPRWKERHQVRFRFTETGPEFHMPPPCSVVIQESEKGHWHIPIVSELEQEDQRMWLCCTRANSSSARPKSEDLQKGSRDKSYFSVSSESVLSSHTKREVRKVVRAKKHVEIETATNSNHELSKQEVQELTSSIKTMVLSSVSENNRSVLPAIEEAEKLGACLIDFQI